MNDKELLELAAKAAGYEAIDFLGYDDGSGYANVYEVDGTHHLFNPLLDDGDALRLAVKLNMCVEIGMPNVTIIHWEMVNPVLEPHGTEPLAATRRAITRAAAEIGKQLNQGETK